MSDHDWQARRPCPREPRTLAPARAAAARTGPRAPPRARVRAAAPTVRAATGSSRRLRGLRAAGLPLRRVAPPPGRGRWTPPPKPGLLPLRPMGFGTLLWAPFRTLRRNPAADVRHRPGRAARLGDRDARPLFVPLMVCARSAGSRPRARPTSTPSSPARSAGSSCSHARADRGLRRRRRVPAGRHGRRGRHRHRRRAPRVRRALEARREADRAAHRLDPPGRRCVVGGVLAPSSSAVALLAGRSRSRPSASVIGVVRSCSLLGLARARRSGSARSSRSCRASSCSSTPASRRVRRSWRLTTATSGARSACSCSSASS